MAEERSEAPAEAPGSSPNQDERDNGAETAGSGSGSGEIFTSSDSSPETRNDPVASGDHGYSVYLVNQDGQEGRFSSGLDAAQEIPPNSEVNHCEQHPEMHHCEQHPEERHCEQHPEEHHCEQHSQQELNHRHHQKQHHTTQQEFSYVPASQVCFLDISVQCIRNSSKFTEDLCVERGV